MSGLTGGAYHPPGQSPHGNARGENAKPPPMPGPQPEPTNSVYLSDPDVTLYHGDALEVLATLPAGSVHMCVTSPPFYGLRDYGVQGQIGLEETPEQWCQSLVDVFREVRRVLRDDGVLFCEVGDSYAANRSYQVSDNKHQAHEFGDSNALRVPPGYKPKDLIGAPWMLAFALRADGWYLRSDVVWARPNPMPESVTDRPTKSHSYIFLLSKSPRYFFDQEAVREPHTPDSRQVTTVHQGNGSIQHRDGERWPNSGRNVRSVWNIATQPYPEAHFATFPEELARRCILAGTSERGCCPECGAPWIRQVDVSHTEAGRGNNNMARKGANHDALTGRPYDIRMLKNVETLGWGPSCKCQGVVGQDRPLGHSGGTETPCTVLDPFVGSGTVPHVARKHGRRAIGIDLNAQYLELASRRLQQQSLFADLSATKGVT